MNVHVKLFSRFRENLPPEARGQATIGLSGGASVDDLLNHLGIVGRVQMIVVNDEPESDRARVLHEGDAVRVFPFVVGG